MEYVIGTIQKRDGIKHILRTKDANHTNFSGRVALEQNLGLAVVRDSFTVIDKFMSSDGPDGAYDWYYIEDHFCQEDHSGEVRAFIEQQITDMEIESIKQEQSLTDAEIAIMELQAKIGG